MIEWANKNKYNSFNSYKGLTYYENYRKILYWLRGKGELPPPIECSLDPIMKCNHHCYYCNSQFYLKTTWGQLSWGDMHDLIEFLAKWGVRGVCFGGGGESTLHSDTSTMINYVQELGMESALVTNGSHLYDGYLLNSLIDCRWVGISLDAADAKTYKKIHGVDMFDQVVDGIRELVKFRKEAHLHFKKGKVAIAIKVLVLPENVDSILDICKLAKDIGVDDFHVRPVDLQRKDYKLAQKLNLDIEKIKENFAKCHEEETDDFHVYTVIHKYDENFHVKHDFKKCLASPLVIQCCTDGNCYVCVDHRMEERFKLGSQKDIKQWWGGDKHRELMQSIDPLTECSRCTWSEYNKQMEVIENDSMCLAFP